MEPSEAIATLRAFNAWRRCDEDSFRPEPRLIGQAIDELCDYVERRENARAIQAMTPQERHALMFQQTPTDDQTTETTK